MSYFGYIKNEDYTFQANSILVGNISHLALFSNKSDITNVSFEKSARACLWWPFLMGFLNAARFLIYFFNSFGTRSQIFGSRNEILSVQWYTEFTLGVNNWEFCLRLFVHFLILKYHAKEVAIKLGFSNQNLQVLLVNRDIIFFFQ